MPRPKKVDRRRGPQLRMGPLIVADAAAQYGIRAPAQVKPGEKFISPNQAAKIINVTGEAVKQWIYHRRLPATRLSNGYWKIKVGDFEEFIKARQNLGQKRIMLIDAAGPASAQIAKAIEQCGHAVVFAHDRADALLKATDLYPSLFIVNVSLKEVDVWDLMKRIRTTRSIRTAPMLVIADHELQGAESELALELDVQGFLIRPFKPQVLIDEIEKIQNRIR